MKQLFLFLAFVLLSLNLKAQVKQFDKLEMLYSQQHYRIVLRKANNLLNKPEHDYSMLPELYKSMALFQLSKNDKWFRRNDQALNEAVELFETIKKSVDGKKVISAHLLEISALKEDLYQWGEDLERLGRSAEVNVLKNILHTSFDDIDNIDRSVGTKGNLIVEVTGKRAEIITYAQKYIGVPYKWAGTTPSGFDCSGYASYVMKEFGIDLPRRAADQFQKSEKVKVKNVQPGDLIFFSNGSGISHVGIVVSTANQTVKMIHASSSHGVIITDVTNSSYWQKRISGYGKYLAD